MILTIKADDKDPALVGYAAATGWKEGNPKTKLEWVREHVSRYVTERARLGRGVIATTAVRETFLEATKVAAVEARVTIPPISVDAAALIALDEEPLPRGVPVVDFK